MQGSQDQELDSNTGEHRVYTGLGRRSVIPYVLYSVVFVLSRGEDYKARELMVAKAKGSDVYGGSSRPPYIVRRT